MTRTERAKALDLSRCNLGYSAWAIRFVRALAWLAEHEPDTVLTPAQKWGLDACVYRYRRQLAVAEYAIPDTPPQRADYIHEHEARVARRREQDEARNGPKPEQERLF
jgi:hypothetical protein